MPPGGSGDARSAPLQSETPSRTWTLIFGTLRRRTLGVSNEGRHSGIYLAEFHKALEFRALAPRPGCTRAPSLAPCSQCTGPAAPQHGAQTPPISTCGGGGEPTPLRSVLRKRSKHALAAATVAESPPLSARRSGRGRSAVGRRRGGAERFRRWQAGAAACSQGSLRPRPDPHPAPRLNRSPAPRPCHTFCPRPAGLRRTLCRA